jgi:hypothetical protein
VLVSVVPQENRSTKVFGGVVVSPRVACVMIVFVVPSLAPWLVRR